MRVLPLREVRATITCPPDRTLECPADVSPSTTGSAVPNDACFPITFNDVTAYGCGVTSTIVREWTAENGSAPASCRQTIRILDTLPPALLGAALEPATTRPPGSPHAPASALTCVSSALVRVRCGLAADACDAAPGLAAAIISRHPDGDPRSCARIEEVVGVGCDELVELRTDRACASRSPRQPCAAVSVRSSGVRAIFGSDLHLEASATDACGNVEHVHVSDVGGVTLCRVPASAPCARSARALAQGAGG